MFTASTAAAGNKHWFENLFFVTIAAFLLCKILDLPTVYPAFGIASLAFQKQPFEILKAKRMFLFLWAVLFAYAFGFMPAYSNNLVALSFFATPLYALAIVSLEEKFGFDQNYFISGLMYVAVIFVLLFFVGVITHFDEIYKLFNFHNIELEMRRGNVVLRNALFNAFVPFTDDPEKQRACVSLFGILLIIISLFGCAGRKGRIAIALLFFLNIAAMSRGAIIWSTCFLLVNFLVRSKFIARIAIASFLLIPVLVMNIEGRLLNGRRPIWDELIKDLSLFGHGLGSAANVTMMTSASIGQVPVIRYPHNIHLEFIYDWGWIVYAAIIIGTLFYCFKYAKVRTALMIWFVLFLNYTIYSPWTVWLLFFAVIADRKLDLSSHKANSSNHMAQGLKIE